MFPPPSLSDGRSVSGHRVAEVPTSAHDRIHEIRLHPASGPQPSGQSMLHFLFALNKCNVLVVGLLFLLSVLFTFLDNIVIWSLCRSSKTSSIALIYCKPLWHLAKQKHCCMRIWRCLLTFMVMCVYNSCFTCRWRPTWAPVLKTPAHSHLRSAPTSWIQMLYVPTCLKDFKLKFLLCVTSQYWTLQSHCLKSKKRCFFKSLVAPENQSARGVSHRYR